MINIYFIIKMASLQEKRQIKGLENCIKDSNSTPTGFRNRLDNLSLLSGLKTSQKSFNKIK